MLQEKVRGQEIMGMLLCTVGTCGCLTFGPLPEEVQESAAAAGLFHHPSVLVYLGVGLLLLLAMLAAEFAEVIGCDVGQGLHYMMLPAATGLAFALEKVFNTEIGFVSPSSSPLLSLAMAGGIAVLGLTDFGLTLRGVTKMPPQVFLPISFTLSTTLQYFQSVFVFGEFKDMDMTTAALSVGSALVALAGALLIRPPRCEFLQNQGHQRLKDAEEELMPCDAPSAAASPGARPAGGAPSWAYDKLGYGHDVAAADGRHSRVPSGQYFHFADALGIELQPRLLLPPL